MNRIEEAAARMVSGKIEGSVTRLAPANAEMPIATFMVFAAGFAVAYAVAHAFGPSVAAETAAYGGQMTDPAELSGTQLLGVRQAALVR